MGLYQDLMQGRGIRPTAKPENVRAMRGVLILQLTDHIGKRFPPISRSGVYTMTRRAKTRARLVDAITVCEDFLGAPSAIRLLRGTVLVAGSRVITPEIIVSFGAIKLQAFPAVGVRVQGGLDKSENTRRCLESLGLPVVAIPRNAKGRIDLAQAPDLATALGWAIATDGGSEGFILGCDLAGCAEKLREVIRKDGVSVETFFDEWHPTLKAVFVRNVTARYGDSYCAYSRGLWRHATREVLGEAHDGYDFSY